MLVTTKRSNSEIFRFMNISWLVKDITHTNIFHFTTLSGQRQQTAAEVGKTTRQQSSEALIAFLSLFPALSLASSDRYAASDWLIGLPSEPLQSTWYFSLSTHSMKYHEVSWTLQQSWLHDWMLVLAPRYGNVDLMQVLPPCWLPHSVCHCVQEISEYPPVIRSFLSYQGVYPQIFTGISHLAEASWLSDRWQTVGCYELTLRNIAGSL